MKLKTYIINLEKSVVRKRYMQELLSPYSFLEVEFITAVDGRMMSQEELRSLFDFEDSLNHYGRYLNPGEIGCTLSHRKVYEAIVQGDSPYALILEDDIAIQKDLNTLDFEGIDKILRTKRPRLLMLSGDYCYYRNTPITKIYSAVGSYAYFANRAAAQLILKITPPCSVADDWLYYKRKGLRLYAVYPYMIDANVDMGLLGSEIQQETWGIDRSKMSAKELLFGVVSGLIKKLFKSCAHFEYKTRVIDNVIVPEDKRQ